MDKATYWSDLQDNFLQHIATNKQLGEAILKKYRTSMKRLLQFAMENELSEYLPELGMAFFEAERQSGVSIITLGCRRACIRKLICTYSEIHFGNDALEICLNINGIYATELPENVQYSFRTVIQILYLSLRENGLNHLPLMLIVFLVPLFYDTLILWV